MTLTSMPRRLDAEGKIHRVDPSIGNDLQDDPAILLKIPIRALELAQILGQPCEFQVRGTGGARPAAR